MKLDTFKKLIKEAVREAVREELGLINENKTIKPYKPEETQQPAPEKKGLSAEARRQLAEQWMGTVKLGGFDMTEGMDLNSIGSEDSMDTGEDLSQFSRFLKGAPEKLKAMDIKSKERSGV